MNLLHLDDDTLVLIFGFLPVSSIIVLRQTCQRLASISKLRFIWRQACIDQVLSKGYPFPARQLANTLPVSDLERQVIRSLRLGAFWTSSIEDPSPRSLEFQASTGTGVSHVRFLSGRGGRYLVTVYKGIWSMISCWDIGDPFRSVKAHKVGDWCPKHTIFSGFVVNSDPESAAALAVAVQHGGGTQSIEVLSVANQDGTPCFQPICSIATTFRPIALRGELIAFSDDGSETVVMNWRENTFALLKGSQRPIDERFQYNRCLQVVFAYKSILVVRARTVELFPDPELRPTDAAAHAAYQPIGSHSFGWIDGVAVSSQREPLLDTVEASHRPRHEPLSIVLRAESDDPWASDVHKLEQFVLAPNPSFDSDPPATAPGMEQPKPATDSPGAPRTDSAIEPPAPAPMPYIFPPARAEHTSPTVRGFLRCRDIALGPAGTALWIQPRAARTAHLTGFDVHSSPTQVADGMNPDFDFLHPAAAPLGPDDALAQTQADVGSGGLAVGSAGSHAEALCAAVFAGPLQRRGFGSERAEGQTRTKTLCVQRKEGCNWTAFDYDEEGGRVALGSSDGSVMVLDLV